MLTIHSCLYLAMFGVLWRKSLIKSEDVLGQLILKNDLPTYSVFSISAFTPKGLGLIHNPVNQTQ